ncbi:phosphatidylinositol-4-phosphate 5-kinase, putative [Entamoeba invadens IP1]|uniref:phosphatidylinositol-4-phosphate 5-kinase, putative n=1 Tax=Entamoeba invadens IP1 TaxID=370355 RepID=UPI0002C3F9C7|nr:phosphatidylinositol-4-phosphate 5-kinase, putative [Entamoeba invadens IP1]ELP90741.1 phosphatidylinositol-4-phosphate 5-kinase, putative [Entamoeba invadens IP1]|eukprot:XP_004257512.1 phosphatidylinositol-4-phosphate 5-kinase, putative [Entamoeba invadens IP1]
MHGTLLKKFQIDPVVNFLNLHAITISVDETQDTTKIDPGTIVCILLHSNQKIPNCSLYNYVIVPNNYSIKDFLSPFLNQKLCPHCNSPISFHKTSLIFSNYKIDVKTALTSTPDKSLNLVRSRCLKCQLCSEAWPIRNSLYDTPLSELLIGLSKTNSLELPMMPPFACKHGPNQILEFTGNGVAVHIEASKYSPFQICRDKSCGTADAEKESYFSEMTKTMGKMSKEIMAMRKIIPTVQKSFETRHNLYNMLNEMETKFLGKILVKITFSQLVRLQKEFFVETSKIYEILQAEIPPEVFRKKCNEVNSFKSEEKDSPDRLLPFKTPQDLVNTRQSFKGSKTLLNTSNTLDKAINRKVMVLHVEEEQMDLSIMWDDTLIFEKDNLFIKLSSNAIPVLFSISLLSESYRTFLKSFKVTPKSTFSEDTLESILTSSTTPHFDFKINKTVGGQSVVLESTLYFAPQFLMLRNLCYGKYHAADVVDQSNTYEDEFIKSIAFILETTTSGGKSKSDFYKSYDERFLLKEMQTVELKAFLLNGPGYFRYMKTHHESLLVRNLGVFTAGMKIGSTKIEKITFLVMENVFYGQHPNKTYDLKGTLKKRTLDEDEMKVGLDGNLVNSLSKKPIVIDKAKKEDMMDLIIEDTKMLEKGDIMDYSLIVGRDEMTQQICVGIIDFLRTFTWDKQIESFVKKIIALGESPTVINPELYRNRLLGFVNSVFMVMPDVNFFD